MYNKHDFLTVDDLSSFNQKVNNTVNRTSQSPKSQQVSTPVYDPNRFDSYIVSPDKLDDQVLYGIVDLFDRNISSADSSDESSNAQFTKYVVDSKSPNTMDKINDAIAVAYITEDGIPVAASTLRDPTIQDYKGIIPGDYYELKSGVSLENRLQQEYFEIHPDFHDMGLAGELRRTLKTIVDDMFVIVPVTDTNTIAGLNTAGYKKMSEFKTDWEQVPVQLWIN